MTIEEFDKKAPIRKTISEIDKCLKEYNNEDIDRRIKPIMSPSTKIIGVGIEVSGSYGCYHCIIRNSTLINKFKEFLLEEKQILLNEFVKEE